MPLNNFKTIDKFNKLSSIKFVQKSYNAVIHNAVTVKVHSSGFPTFRKKENLSFARKPTEDIILVIRKIPRSSAELIKFLGGNLEQ